MNTDFPSKDSAEGLEKKRVFFDASKMGDPQYNYVCWFDVMGTEKQMLRSVQVSANFIYKLHCAVQKAWENETDRANISLYPVMDGVYITSPRREPLERVLKNALEHLAITFVCEKRIEHCFLVRGAIAYGTVFHGKEVQKEASYVLGRNTDVKNFILLGLPMIQAYRSESNAAPFGIAIDESARGFAPEGNSPFRFVWWRWLGSRSDVSHEVLMGKLCEYFKWQRKFTNTTGYPIDRIDHHEKLAEEYFSRD